MVGENYTQQLDRGDSALQMMVQSYPETDQLGRNVMQHISKKVIETSYLAEFFAILHESSIGGAQRYALKIMQDNIKEFEVLKNAIPEDNKDLVDLLTAQQDYLKTRVSEFHS